MTTLPNDDFDMCCGSRPHVTSTVTPVYPTVDVTAKCGICGDTVRRENIHLAMIAWNKRKREEAK